VALTPGTRLGSYEIVAALGAGGMGEVYRARDTTLGRQVAIKILPDAFAADPERLARFEREAKTLASLNHPHIAAIYAVEQSADLHALVMELVEGEDLSQRIARGAIPIDEALPIAKQVAEALEAAHEQGIIHRDLKPANIKVRSDGTVKVLDFGLAKAMEPTGAMSASASMSPTITTPAMTLAGMILGTAAYMSPEQARGKTVDRRADIWAFGVVLYEMLAGQRLFAGEEISDTLAAVLKTAPDWQRLPAATPAGLRRLLQRCLEKDPRRRLQAIGEARVQIEDAVSRAPDGAGVPGVAPARPRSPWSSALPWTLAASTLVFAIAWLIAWAPWRVETPLDRPLVRLDVDLGPDVSLPALSDPGSFVLISPDGTRLVYASGTPKKLFTRRLDQPNATELQGTQGAARPFFSPDGQWVGFVAGEKVNKIAVNGGAVVPLGDVANFAGATWGEDGRIVVSDAFGKGLLRMPSGGGPPEIVAGLGTGEQTLALPQMLPGGKAILFAAFPTGADLDKNTIEVLTLTDHRRKVVVRGGQSPRYLATSNGAGHLVYVNHATLFAVPFDLAMLETRGTAVPVLDDVGYSDIGSGQFDVSGTGVLVYRRASDAGAGLLTVAWLDASGKTQPLLAKPGVYTRPSLSPDGQRLALEVTEGSGRDIWVYDWQRDAMTRVTFSGNVQDPVWSPDGRFIVFEAGAAGLSVTRSDGAGQPQSLTQSKSAQDPFSFTPDGKRLAFMEQKTGIKYSVWTVPLDGDGAGLRAGKPEAFLQTPADERHPAFSPDGRWLAYASDESGTF